MTTTGSGSTDDTPKFYETPDEVLEASRTGRKEGERPVAQKGFNGLLEYVADAYEIAISTQAKGLADSFTGTKYGEKNTVDSDFRGQFFDESVETGDGTEEVKSFYERMESKFTEPLAPMLKGIGTQAKTVDQLLQKIDESEDLPSLVKDAAKEWYATLNPSDEAVYADRQDKFTQSYKDRRATLFKQQALAQLGVEEDELLARVKTDVAARVESGALPEARKDAEIRHVTEGIKSDFASYRTALTQDEPDFKALGGKAPVYRQMYETANQVALNELGIGGTATTPKKGIVRRAAPYAAGLAVVGGLVVGGLALTGNLGGAAENTPAANADNTSSNAADNAADNTADNAADNAAEDAEPVPGSADIGEFRAPVFGEERVSFTYQWSNPADAVIEGNIAGESRMAVDYVLEAARRRGYVTAAPGSNEELVQLGSIVAGANGEFSNYRDVKLSLEDCAQLLSLMNFETQEVRDDSGNMIRRFVEVERNADGTTEFRNVDRPLIPTRAFEHGLVNVNVELTYGSGVDQNEVEDLWNDARTEYGRVSTAGDLNWDETQQHLRAAQLLWAHQGPLNAGRPVVTQPSSDFVLSDDSVEAADSVVDDLRAALDDAESSE